MPKGIQNPKVKKALSISLNVILYLFFAICLIALVLSVMAKKDADGAMDIFGRQLRIVRSESMEKSEATPLKDEWKIKDIPIKSMVFIETVPEDKAEREAWYAALKEGDVLTFRYLYVTQETITHRIKTITKNTVGEGYTIVLEGDNKASDGETLTQTINTAHEDSPNYIIGKVTGQSYPFGLLITAVKSPVGIVCIIIIPSAIIAILEIIRLVSLLNAGKKKKEKEENDRRDAELEEMRRQLALLQQSAALSGNASASTEKSTESPSDTPESDS